MFCIDCGHSIPSDAQFCFKCGTKVPPEISRSKQRGAPILDYSNPINLQSGLGQNTARQEETEKLSTSSYFRLSLLCLIGLPAFIAVIGLPMIAEYVIFRFHAISWLNGGWLHWYAGESAIVARAAYEGDELYLLRNILSLPRESDTYSNTLFFGMDAGYARILLWCVFGFIGGIASRDVLKSIRLIRREIVK